MKNMELNKVTVYINLEGFKTELGVLVNEKRNIYFKLSPSYLKEFKPFATSKLLVSPFKMKHSDEIQTCSLFPFDGLFGIFSDSLPDAWGKLLLDRFIISTNKTLTDVNPLNRLLYVGKIGNGALEYEPQIENYFTEIGHVDIEEYYQASKKLLAGGDATILSNFYRLGGTSGGARPKINVGLNQKTNHLIDTFENLPTNYEAWLVKFPSTYDLPDCANIEFAYHKMALACGIEMSEAKLLKGQGRDSFFASKRFDRIANKKLHVHSLAGLLQDDFRNTSLDYGHLLDAGFYLEKDVAVYQKILRLAAFNVFASNQDDHSKNFSFLLNKKGEWKFSPAYDLTFSQGNYGFQSLSVAKKSKNIESKDFLILAKHFQIENAQIIIDEVKEQLSNWTYFANEAGVSEHSKKLIKKVIDEKIRL